MEDLQELVTEFHERFGHRVGRKPALLSPEEAQFRAELITEELSETLVALLDGDLVELVDGLADSIYVLVGTAVAMGINLAPIIDIVHQSNMSKEPGSDAPPEGPEGQASLGKPIKGEAFWAPTEAITYELREQGADL